jgi:hypothetical protein
LRAGPNSISLGAETVRAPRESPRTAPGGFGLPRPRFQLPKPASILELTFVPLSFCGSRLELHAASRSSAFPTDDSEKFRNPNNLCLTSVQGSDILGAIQIEGNSMRRRHLADISPTSRRSSFSCFARWVQSRLRLLRTLDCPHARRLRATAS